MLSRGEPGRRVGADFRDDRRRGTHPDPRDRCNQLASGTKGMHQLLDLLVESTDHRIELIQMSQVQPTHQGMVIIEAPFQRPLQIGDLRAHTAARQISQHRRAAFTVDERLHHRPHRLGGDRGRHAVGLDPGVLKHIAQALQLRGAMLDQLAAVADHVAGGLDVGGRNQPTPQQTAFQQVHQPLGIQEVGFAARPFFTCPALHTSSSLAVGQQRVISGRTSAHHVLLRLPARPTPAVAGRSPWPAAWRIGIRAS
ncbi:Uncharacterised protein [Mycobacterium tuberculosis]|nr:Uncharacterised protein [Mycobacterium tuberculosis]